MSKPVSPVVDPIRSGEIVESEFIRIVFQRGLPQDVGINGCRVEDLIEIAVGRLNAYQAGPLACVENEQALAGLKTAISALKDRRDRRQDQGVYHTMSRHQTFRTEDHHEDFSATGA